MRKGNRFRRNGHIGHVCVTFRCLFSLFPLPRLGPSLSLSIPLRFMMTTPHVIASSSTHTSQPATTTGVVGNHFRVGKKIGEGSFGVVFEGIFLLYFLLIPCSILPCRYKSPHQPAGCYQVCESFLHRMRSLHRAPMPPRNRASQTRLNCGMSIAHTAP